MIRDASNYVANVRRAHELWKNYQRKQNQKLVHNAIATTVSVFTAHLSCIKTIITIRKKYRT